MRDALHSEAPEEPSPSLPLPPPEAWRSTTTTACQSSGLRPARLAGVRLQERVQRHSVEQIIDTFALVPTLDALVSLVRQLVEVLKIADTLALEVSKIALEDGTPRHTELHEPRVVELR